MLVIALSMLLAVLLAGVIVVYVAFPHRGEDIPAVPWLGRAMSWGRRALPVQEHPADDFEDVAPTDLLRSR